MTQIEKALAESNETAVIPSLLKVGSLQIAGQDVSSTRKRVVSIVSSATPSINSDACDVFQITAQAADITSFTSGLTGSPDHWDGLIVSITGTAARAITWGSAFEASTVDLPTTTSSTDTLDVGFRFNAFTGKWRCVAVA